MFLTNSYLARQKHQQNNFTIFFYKNASYFSVIKKDAVYLCFDHLTCIIKMLFFRSIQTFATQKFCSRRLCQAFVGSSTKAEMSGLNRVHKFNTSSNDLMISTQRSSTFSSVANFQNKKSYPKHVVFGETCAFSMSPIMPTFRSTGEGGNVISVGKRGRMMFQFSPSTQSGVQWNNQISFALQVEELGLLINQLPFHDVKFTRKLGGDHGNGMNGKRYNVVSDNDDGVYKTLTVTPIEGAAILLEVDYKKDGVGGQTPPADSNEHNWSYAPMSIILNAGEWEVVRLISQDSIPSILGWRASMDIATNDAIANRS